MGICSRVYECKYLIIFQYEKEKKKETLFIPIFKV